MKKILIILAVILLSFLPVKSLYKFYTTPDLAKLVLAAQGDCKVPKRYEKSIKYRIEHFYSKIYRSYIFQFGVDEVLEDGTHSLHFLPISYDINNGICKTSSIKLFERLLEFGHDINKKGNHSAFNKSTKITLLHDVILAGDKELVRYLLKKGADPMVKVQMYGKKIDQMNSIELAEYLSEKKDTESRRLIEIILKKSI